MRAFDVFWIEMYFLALLTIVDASASQMCTFSNLSTNGQVVKAKIFRSFCCCCCGCPTNRHVEKTKIIRSYIFMKGVYASGIEVKMFHQNMVVLQTCLSLMNLKCHNPLKQNTSDRCCSVEEQFG